MGDLPSTISGSSVEEEVAGFRIVCKHSILFPLEIGSIARETLLVTQTTLYGQT